MEWASTSSRFLSISRCFNLIHWRCDRIFAKAKNLKLGSMDDIVRRVAVLQYSRTFSSNVVDEGENGRGSE